MANSVGWEKNRRFLPPMTAVAKNELKNQNNGKGEKPEGQGKQVSVDRQNDNLLHCPFCGSPMTWWRGSPFCPHCGWREGCCD